MEAKKKSNKILILSVAFYTIIIQTSLLIYMSEKICRLTDLLKSFVIFIYNINLFSMEHLLYYL